MVLVMVKDQSPPCRLVQMPDCPEYLEHSQTPPSTITTAAATVMAAVATIDYATATFVWMSQSCFARWLEGFTNSSCWDPSLKILAP